MGRLCSERTAAFCESKSFSGLFPGSPVLYEPSDPGGGLCSGAGWGWLGKRADPSLVPAPSSEYLSPQVPLGHLVER